MVENVIMNIKNKKLLLLGGKPIGSCEIVRYAKSMGVYTIVADYLSVNDSPAKQIADEYWDISTADLDGLEKLARDNKIDGVLAAVHEFNIEKMIDLCERLHLPCYCNHKTWNLCTNKSEFKQLCIKNNVPVTPQYKVDIDDENAIRDLPYPVIVKPVDGSGSRGFSICNDSIELISNYKNALKYSDSKQVLIEKYMPYDTVIIHYTLSNGNIFFSGMSDKYSVKFETTGSMVMGLQLFPSKNIEDYIKTLDDRVCKMFQDAGLKEGPLWIEAFNNNGDFTFNEMGYRFGGSLTYYPVKYFCGMDQLDMLVEYSLTGESSMRKPEWINFEKTGYKYCIFPMHVKPGKIEEVEGIKELIEMENIISIVPVHHKGDVINNWGSAQQVHCYVHAIYYDMADLKLCMKHVSNTLKVKDAKGDNLLFTLFDINKLK